MRRSVWLGLTILISWTLVQAVPQAGMSASQSSAPAGAIGPSAVWQPPQDFINKAHAVCDKSAGPADPAQCFINQMAAAGAPADAVSFTRMLFQQSDGQVGFMSAFQKLSPVDAVQVLYPLRANDNYGLLLVNGDPKVLDVDDLKKLDQAGMDQDTMFQAVKKKYPEATVWPGDRSSSTPWPRVRPLANGGTEFIVSYPLINGCHACLHLGVARFGWDFDATGKFLRTVYVITPPPAKILRRPTGPPATQTPGSQPSTPQQAPPATPPPNP